MGRVGGSADVELDHPIDAVWEVVSDFDHAAEWQGTIGEIEVLERDAAGRGTRVTTSIDAKVKVLRSTAAVTYAEPTRVAWRQERGDLSALEGSWTLEDLGGGRTRATYALQIDPGFALGMLIRGDVEEKLRQRLVLNRPEELRRRLAG